VCIYGVKEIVPNISKKKKKRNCAQNIFGQRGTWKENCEWDSVYFLERLA
jgi:hypothetical protein